jgi:hypothetical protein
MTGLEGDVGDDDADCRAGPHPLDGGKKSASAADSVFAGARFRHEISVPGETKAAEYGYSGSHGYMPLE